jgi:hypothetical protein
MSDLESQKQAERLCDDLLVGAADISAEMGETEDAVYYLYKKKLAPIGKRGGNLIAFRSELRRHARKLIEK